MDAKEIHAGVSTVLNEAGLERAGRSQWVVRWPELLWMVQMDRYQAKAWGVMFGALVRGWTDGEAPQGYSDLHVFQEYPHRGAGVPAAAMGTRFDDHASFFTMVMDHRHDLVADEVRLEAFQFLADDLASLFDRVRDLAQLVHAVRTDEVGGFVDQRLADLAHETG